MGNRRVARLLLLFSTLSPAAEKLNLAYVQLFRVVSHPDGSTGMYKIRKEDKYEVVEIDTIERGVHLIPCFVGYETKMANRFSRPALDVYKDYWINNQIDLHMYNTIY